MTCTIVHSARSSTSLPIPALFAACMVQAGALAAVNAPLQFDSLLVEAIRIRKAVYVPHASLEMFPRHVYVFAYTPARGEPC